MYTLTIVFTGIPTDPVLLRRAMVVYWARSPTAFYPGVSLLNNRSYSAWTSREKPYSCTTIPAKGYIKFFTIKTFFLWQT